MLNNNKQRLSIWKLLENKFDYALFTEECSKANCQIMPPLEFAQKVGMLSVACVLYPEIPVEDAYIKFATKYVNSMTTETNNNNNKIPTLSKPLTTNTKTNCCGGGKVL